MSEFKDRNRPRSDPREQTLFKTRQRFLVNMESTVIRFIILVLLIYYFTNIIAYTAMIQGNYSTLITVPFVQWVTEGLVLIIIILTLWLIWNILSWRSKWYIITSQRVMINSGVISKKSVYMHYNKMQDIIVSQGFIQRISYAGDIEIFGGRDRTSLILKNIPKPNDVETRINQMIDKNECKFSNQQKNKPWKTYD